MQKKYRHQAEITTRPLCINSETNKMDCKDSIMQKRKSRKNITKLKNQQKKYKTNPPIMP